VIAEVDDGFCPSSRVLELLGDYESRAAGKGLRRAIRQGYLTERRGPDGRLYVSVSPEGWRTGAAGDTVAGNA
jgi:hypothetical protein